jgi:hypothetical protein
MMDGILLAGVSGFVAFFLVLSAAKLFEKWRDRATSRRLDDELEKFLRNVDAESDADERE